MQTTKRISSTSFQWISLNVFKYEEMFRNGEMGPVFCHEEMFRNGEMGPAYQPELRTSTSIQLWGEHFNMS